MPSKRKVLFGVNCHEVRVWPVSTNMCFSPFQVFVWERVQSRWRVGLKKVEVLPSKYAKQ